MPKGLKGERRPAEVIGNAVHGMRIATGEVEEAKPDPVTSAKRRWAARTAARAAAVARLFPQSNRPTSPATFADD